MAGHRAPELLQSVMRETNLNRKYAAVDALCYMRDPLWIPMTRTMLGMPRLIGPEAGLLACMSMHDIDTSYEMLILSAEGNKEHVNDWAAKILRSELNGNRIKDPVLKRRAQEAVAKRLGRKTTLN